ncbi:hypothetical protein RJ639_029105 [Escallonia herrerae]|uniref:Uncharacterized protein n=1 Tax=Escallonia herrerae TaxID=1293975 RepID=A0AA89BG31_9ASTE|nr:hypothetical protein RJ639_029105 [Escallonia herrerae]
MEEAEAETTPSPGNLSRKVIDIAAGEAHTLALAVFMPGEEEHSAGSAPVRSPTSYFRFELISALQMVMKKSGSRRLLGFLLVLTTALLLQMTDRFGPGVTISVSFIRKF